MDVFNDDAIVRFFDIMFRDLSKDEWVEFRIFGKDRAWMREPVDIKNWIARRRGDSDIFYGPVTRRIHKGMKRDCLRARCLWADVDFKDIAEAEVGRKMAAFPLKPSCWTATGGGIHLYWFLSESVPIAVKNGKDTTIEPRLKALARYFNGDMDSTDASRILRVPHTFNFKDEYTDDTGIHPAVLIQDFDETLRYTLDEFNAVLGLKEPEQMRLEPVAVTGEETSVENDDSDEIKQIMECEFLQYCDRERATLPEPLWYAMISNLAPLPGGRRKIHKLSEGYSGSTPEETDAKILHAIDSSGPHTCEFIASHWCDPCQLDCGVRSPIGLARKSRQAKLKPLKGMREKEDGEDRSRLVWDVTMASETFRVKEIPVKETILDPWLREQDIVLLSGWRGVGKSNWTLGLMDCITKGVPFGPWRVKRAVNVLYVDGELPGADLQQRLEMVDSFERIGRKTKLLIYSDHLRNMMGLPRGDLTMEDWREGLLEYCKEEDVKIVVFDNLSSLYPVNEQSKEEWDIANRYMLDLRFNGIVPLMIHHTGKSKEDQRGTSGREDNIDTSILLAYPDGYSTSEGLRFTVKFKKTRIPQAKLDKLGEWEFWMEEQDNEVTGWKWKACETEKEKAILSLLKQGMQQSKIAEALGVTPAYVSKVKKKRLEKGKS